ncbi:MAG: cobalamin synthase, partial [Desulfovibrio sp.]|nr:cobalamin synthase [Desulfovibrio sp.]
MAAIVEFDSGEAFFGKPDGIMAAGYAEPDQMVPQEDPNYLFPAWSADIAIWLADAREPLYLFGPTGCGKTSCI